MPVENPFSKDRSDMVEAVFAEQDASLVARLRERAQRKASKEELANVSGISDDTLLEKLLRADVSAGTFLCLSMIPLIEVAWADNKMDPPEREAIHRAAADHGIEDGSDPALLLQGWLTRRPPDDLLETWMTYSRDIASTLSQSEKDKLRHELLGSAREIARAAGGFLGLGSGISKSEQKMLDRLATVFD